MLSLWNAFDDVMRTEPWFTSVLSGVAGSAVWPVVDVSENDEAFFITAELPGVKLDDVKLEIEGDTLALSAEKRHEPMGDENAFHHVERRYGSFVRRFGLPELVDRQNIKAEMKDGILTITLPKTEAARPRQIPIQIASSGERDVRQIEATGEAAASSG